MSAPPSAPRRASTARRFWAYFRPYYGRFPLVLLLVLLAAGVQPALVFLIQHVLDDLLVQRDAARLAALPLAVVGLYGLNGVLTVGRTLLTRRMTWAVLTQVRREVYAHLLRLDVGWHQSRPSGERVSRLMADVNNLQYATSGVVTALQKPITLIGLMVTAFVMNPRLAVVALVVVPLVAVPIDRFGKWVRRASGQAQDSAARLAASAQETLAGIRVVQLAHGESQRLAAFDALNLAHEEAQLHALTAQLLPSPVVEFIAAIGVAAAIGVGASDVIAGRLQAGELVAFLLSVGLMNDPLKGLAQLTSLVQRSLASAETLFALLDTPSALPDRGTLPARPPAQIALEDVGFRYSPDGEPVLRGVSFVVRAGERVAVVGTSGSGKSTLLSLLTRLRDPSEGAIRWDGVDLRDFQLASLRDQLAVVTQEPFLFDDTIAANIRFGRPDASDAEVEAAARVANAHDFVAALPAGYATRIDELGMRLSGGQRQRICIARAVLRAAPVLVLDEATSNLDAESEGLVQEALERLMRGRTTFLVAHRLSTVREADRIVVIADGRVVEMGRHAELMAADGPYARLVARQG